MADTKTFGKGDTFRIGRFRDAGGETPLQKASLSRNAPAYAGRNGLKLAFCPLRRQRFEFFHFQIFQTLCHLIFFLFQ